jgi:hypothetical protein
VRRRRGCGQRPRGDLGEGEGPAGDVQQRGLAGGRGGVSRGGIRSGGCVKTGEASGRCGGSECVADLFLSGREERGSLNFPEEAGKAGSSFGSAEEAGKAV